MSEGRDCYFLLSHREVFSDEMTFEQVTEEIREMYKQSSEQGESVAQ